MGLQYFFRLFLYLGDSPNSTVAALNLLVDVDRLGLADFILAVPSSSC
jgi:hypothetical protein